MLGVRHHRFEGVEFTGQPCGQTVRQQAEGGVAFATVPASDVRPARGLARIGAVACQRTVPVRVIRAAIEPCIAPRLGPNVLLAGKPRLIAKLHRPWPGGVPPARANSSVVRRGVEITTTALATPSGEDVDASFGTERRPTDRVDKPWRSWRFPTACPHSALSRPHPHRFCNNDS